MSSSRQHAFCVVGMHRSGTSLIAGMLAHNDVHMGAHLLESQSDNPLGFYEDSEFVRFHEDCLDRRGWTYADPGCLRIEFDDDERRRAVKLVEARSSCGTWGWKDPRTCLFLDQWLALVPECRFIVVYRHPVDVLASLLRRGEQVAVADVTAGLRMWKGYNQAIVEFLRRHSPPAVVVEADAVVADPGALCGAAGALELDLAPDRVRPLVHPDRFNRLPAKTVLEPLLEAIDPEILQLHAALRESADVSGDGSPPCPAPVREQLERLVGLRGLVRGPQGRPVAHALLLAALCIGDRRIGEKIGLHQAEAIKAARGVLTLEMRTFMAREQAVAAEAAAASSAMQLEQARAESQRLAARAAELEGQLSSLRSYTEQVEHERNIYRRRWPPYAARRSVQKLRTWVRKRSALGIERFGHDTAVCVMLTGLPEHADAVALQALLRRQTRRVQRLVLPGDYETLQTHPPADDVVVHNWFAPDLPQLNAGHDFTLVLHPESYGAGVFWSPVLVEMLVAALASTPDAAAVVLRGEDGPPRTGTPNHVHESDAATIESWPEETLAALFRSPDFCVAFAEANPAETRSIRATAAALARAGRPVLIGPRSFPTGRRQAEASAWDLGARLPARPRAVRRGLYISQWIECGGADKGIVDLLGRVDPGVIDFSFMTTVASQHAWEDRIRPHVREIIHLGDALPLPADDRFPRFIVEYVRRRGIGIVHIMHSLLAYDALPLLRAALGGVRVIDQCHILEPPHIMEGGHPAYSSRRYKELLDHRTVTSRWLKRYLTSEHGIAEDRISVIYTGVDWAEEFNPDRYAPGVFRDRLGVPRQSPLVVFIGRLYWQKRPWLILRIAGEVQRRRPDLDVWFALVGSGPERERLEELRHKLLRPQQFILAGEVDHGGVVLRDADVMLLTSGHEGLAYVSYEAMAMGVPQITTDVNAQSELVTPECGILLADAGDEDAVVEGGTRALIGLLDDPKRLEAMGEAARRRVVDGFGIDAMVREYERLYRRLQPG